MPQDICPIWKTFAIIKRAGPDGSDVESPRAGGRYFISGTAKAIVQHKDDILRVQLTTWLVNQRRLGVECPEITSDTLSKVEHMSFLSVHDRADALLRYLGGKSDLLGTVVKFYALDNTNAPETANELLAWTASRQMSEVVTLAEYCSEEGWIDHRVTERAGASRNNVHELMLRPPGYMRLAEFEGINSGSKQVFVAMWFDVSMTEVYENGIEPAIREAGYEPLRIDQKQHIKKIDDEIIAEIKRSRFLIADFTQGETGARGGVYYEAGFAHGLNIPVIFTCHKDTISDVHFDTRQYNHIIWDTPKDLYIRLAQRISAVIGDGPLKKVH